MRIVQGAAPEAILLRPILPLFRGLVLQADHQDVQLLIIIVFSLGKNCSSKIEYLSLSLCLSLSLSLVLFFFLCLSALENFPIQPQFQQTI